MGADWAAAGGLGQAPGVPRSYVFGGPCFGASRIVMWRECRASSPELPTVMQLAGQWESPPHVFHHFLAFAHAPLPRMNVDNTTQTQNAQTKTHRESPTF